MNIKQSTFLLLITLHAAAAYGTQTPWNVVNIQGYSIDPATGKVDDTEGFGAFDSIMELFKPTCSNNFDNGGGSFDSTSEYVKYTYNINNFVYDPFMRPEEHNANVLQVAAQNPFDCCTSMSVLNVIDTKDARRAHIQLCYDVLKNGGTAFFKIWPGNGSGIPITQEGRFQSNQNAAYYINEIQEVFGSNNVVLANEKTIKAMKVTQ